uniref:Uncharacterized protein n=1 Tax=Setaria digitata TaxID=48799 RepID=A0A915PBX1_9BILA
MRVKVRVIQGAGNRSSCLGVLLRGANGEYAGCVMSAEKKSVDEIGTAKSLAKNDVLNIPQSSKPAKLAKQNGVDEEEVEDLLVVEECNKKLKSKDEVKERTVMYVQQRDDSNTHEAVLMPPHRVSLNVTVSAKPKALVRSHAFSGDDDSGVSARHTPASRFLGSRSTFSSASFDSGHGHDYTDSTGINLLSFITCTLHKNSKDRLMLLQLEQHMTKLIKDTTPDVDFLSLIQGDVYTDEPRRLLGRDTQSYEEGRQSISASVLFGRRTRSFEVSDCLSGDPATVTVGCGLPAAPSLHMHLLHQQGSTSTDASSTHVGFLQVFPELLESPGSCYSYGDMPFLGVYSASEDSPSLSSTTHLFPWSSSESYTSFSPDYPSNLISPVMHNHHRPSTFTREVNIDTNTSLYRTLSTHSSFPEQRSHISRHTNPGITDWQAVHSREASVPENILPGNVHCDEQMVEIAASQQQTQPLYAAPPPTTNFMSNQYIVNTVPEQTTYAVVPPYLHYSTPILSVQKLTHQMESLCTTGCPEIIPAIPQPYLVSPPPAQTLYPQQFLISSQVSSVYSPQPYLVPFVQRNYVPNIGDVQGTYPVSVAQYTVSNYECSSVQRENLVDAVRISKSEPIFEGSSVVTDNKNVTN